DSFTWVALLGFEYDFDGVWAGRIGVGYQQRNYNSPLIKTLEGPAVEGRLSWSPTQLTTFTLNVARTLEESIRQDAVSYVRTTGGVRVDHEFLRNIILGGEVRVDRREYERPNQTATDGVLEVNSRWLLNRSLSVVGSYAYNRRLEATGGFLEYERHLVQARLRIAL
ncbi:MAG: outer membrane beta-barrel protein, partial [Acetobacteraceae bacterium]|nr:outer membrane beta-barrel protein [Acetobacteraceae bacterium]